MVSGRVQWMLVVDMCRGYESWRLMRRGYKPHQGYKKKRYFTLIIINLSMQVILLFISFMAILVQSAPIPEYEQSELMRRDPRGNFFISK